MSNTRVRGLIAFAVILFVAIVFCGWVPFALMPGAGVAVALPVITVPAEIVVPGGFFGLNLTNTLIATFVTDAILLLFIALAWQASKGWTKQVPNRFQAWVEMFAETLYNFSKGLAGDRLRTTPLLWPIVATIFIFLFTANMMKLLPGVETIGMVHCAHVGTASYPRIDGAGGPRLYVDTPLNAGISTTEEMEHACVTYLEEQAGITGEHSEEAPPESEGGEEAAPADESASTIVLTADEEEDPGDENAEAEEPAETIAVEPGDTCMATLDSEEDRALLVTTREQFHDACFPLTEDEIAAGVIPYAFAVTPFLRGPATDLNVAFGLALLSIALVQVYGVYALGPAYFEKFLNITALGKLGQKPMGLIDFVVGLIEIISEIGKVVSLAFRLFGNLFAGGIVLIVMSFLVAMLIPGVFYGLEIIIGTVQALVFSVLTLVFSVQAMEAHHGDEHEHDEAHH